jgi:3-dehydro-4-phosphotetronate decarboxylase
MSAAAQRADICRIGQSLFDRGLVHATAGNISVRLPEGQGFLITPTDACLGFLDPSTLAHASDDGTPIGDARPSKTLTLHRHIYAADATAQCIVHTHATHLVALTLAGVWKQEDILPPITPYYVMKVGHVPLIDYHRPGDPAVAALVAERIAAAAKRDAPIRAVMLDRLGPVVWGETPSAAMATLEELEETAKLWLMTKPTPAPLSDQQLDELRRTFGARW